MKMTMVCNGALQRTFSAASAVPFHANHQRSYGYRFYHDAGKAAITVKPFPISFICSCCPPFNKHADTNGYYGNQHPADHIEQGGEPTQVYLL
jgi:hypothetical protein